MTLKRITKTCADEARALASTLFSAELKSPEIVSWDQGLGGKLLLEAAHLDRNHTTRAWSDRTKGALAYLVEVVTARARVETHMALLARTSLARSLNVRLAHIRTQGRTPVIQHKGVAFVPSDAEVVGRALNVNGFEIETGRPVSIFVTLTEVNLTLRGV